MDLFEAVFFDFDGVIADSVETKTEAYRVLFKEYGEEIVEKIVQYQLTYGGLSRFKKFEWAYENLLHLPLSEQRSQELGQAFSDIVEQQVIDCAYIPGALDAIQALKDAGVPMFVVSGTPEEELVRIVSRKPEIAGVFDLVCGSPALKPDIINRIIAAHGFNRASCLFVGDAITDYQAAKATSLPFLGIVKAGEASPFPLEEVISDSVIQGLRTWASLLRSR